MANSVCMTLLCRDCVSCGMIIHICSCTPVGNQRDHVEHGSPLVVIVVVVVFAVGSSSRREPCGGGSARFRQAWTSSAVALETRPQLGGAFGLITCEGYEVED